MYQSISYNYYTKKTVIRDDKKGWVDVDYKPIYYKLDKEGEFFTIDGRRVSPVKDFDKSRPNEYFEIDVPIETNALVDIYKDSDDAPEWHNIVYLDIECEIGGALTTEYIKRAPMKITSIALYDVTLKKYYCLILDEKRQINQVEEDNKEIIPYNTEKDLLKGFLNKWEECDPTIISGWNSEFFDMPYLYHRMCQVVGDQHAKRLSPLKRVQVKSTINRKTGSEESFVKIEGINHLDYMLLHKKFITKQEPSYKLDAIGEKYAGINKIEYEGSLDDLFERDVHKFIEYNLRDVEILVALDDKLQFIALTQNICHLCHVAYENIYYSTALNEGAILTYLRRENIVSPNKPTTYNQALKAGNEEYAGGYLLEPTPGLYTWLIDNDYSSLYPSIIRSLNLGIDTYVGHIKNRTQKEDCWWGLQDLKEKNPTETITIQNKEGKIVDVEVGKLIEIIEKKKYTISASGTMFKTDSKSIVSQILEDWFNKRKQYKAKMKEAYLSGNNELGAHYNRLQHAFKIKLNDVYGCFAINSWRYSDGKLIMSQAITLTGQRMIKETIKEANKIVEEMLLT
jgi:DNA polymerase elongation subunit (family B)